MNEMTPKRVTQKHTHLKTWQGKTMNGTLQQIPMIENSLTVFPVLLLQACAVWRENADEAKEHNQTPQKFTEARLYLLKKGTCIVATWGCKMNAFY